MPYNTRRKSLSLPSLGIHVPNSSRSHRSLSASKDSSATQEHFPPSKKVKRSHDSESASPDSDRKSPSIATHEKTSSHSGRSKSVRRYEHTPPPSPGDASMAPRIDTDGIHDDVVVSAIQQLEKTGNKPHLVRELAAILTTVSETVANSANPAALLSSRLSAYMKRPWTALSPCPIAKELINVHPRKVFYFLTTYPHQPLPDNLDDVILVDGKQITPSLSSASIDQDEEDARSRERARLSPSPEIDLSSPEFEEEQGDLHAQRSSHSSASGNAFPEQRTHRLAHNHRAASPPLEGDEREFTQTASSVRERASEEKANRRGTSSASSVTVSEESNGQQDTMDCDPPSAISEKMNEDQYGDYFSNDGSRDRDQELDEAAAAALFGTSPSPSLASVSSSLSSGTTAPSDAGSPADGLLSLKQNIADSVRGATPVSVVEEVSAVAVSTLKRSIEKVETGFSIKSEKEPKQLRTFDFEMALDSWNELRSPETVEVDELDEMFGDI